MNALRPRHAGKRDHDERSGVLRVAGRRFRGPPRRILTPTPRGAITPALRGLDSRLCEPFSAIRLQEITSSGGPRTKASFLLAVPGPRKDADADFIRVETWGKQAENLVKYNGKGSRVAVTGYIRSRFFNRDGGKTGGELRSAVVAQRVEYLQSRRQSPATQAETPEATKGPRR